MKYIVTLLTLLVSTTVFAADNLVEKFFSDVPYRNIKISPDGKHLAVAYDEGNQVKLAIINRKSQKVTASFGFGDYEQINSFYWANNERILMEPVKFVGYLDTKGGMPSLVAANIDGSKRKRIFKIDTAGYQVLHMLPDEPRKVLISKRHYKDRGAVKLQLLDIYTGKQTYYPDQPKDDVFGIGVDIDGEPRIGFKYKEEDDDELGKGTLTTHYKPKKGGSWKILDLSSFKYKPGDNLNVEGFSEDGNTAYISSDSQTKTTSVYKFNMRTNELKEIAKDDTADLASIVTGRNGEAIGARFMPNYPKTVYFEEEHKDVQILKALQQAFKYKNVSILNYTEDKKTAVVYTNSDKDPGTFYLMDTKSLKLSHIASMRPTLKDVKLHEMEPFKIKARDGVTLNGYLTLPHNKEANLPTVMMLHGGPHGPRDNWGFNPEVQYLASLGYAVVQVNFRGSGGYGKEFMESGYRKWGREMQDDVTDATKWAIAQKIADPERICIYGGSYGGYTTLMGVVREPDLYKCALGYVGVYSLPEMFTAGDIPTRKSGKKFLKKVLGEDQVELEANSPSFNVDKIKAALFIAHGEDDVRVPMEQYDALIEALEKRGYPYESMVKDEGHGYQKEENKFEFYSKMAEFFNKHIGS